MTAVATKPDSDALFFEGRGQGTIINVDAKSIIARGHTVDVLAEGFSKFDPPQPNTGANVSITLDHSNYVTTDARTDTGGGTATITPAGSGTNQTGAVVFAADGYHEVFGSGSMTIDHGAVDAFSGTTDVDGQSRTIGLAPDIGADELAFPTTTNVSCAPNPLQLGMGPTRCGVTVTDASSPPPVRFLAGVRLGSQLPGTIKSACEVLPAGMRANCFFLFTPKLAGPQRVSATFPGDATHDSSQDTDLLRVVLPVGAPAPGPAPVIQPPLRRAKCKKKKKHHHGAKAAKMKKCKKKRKKRR